MQATIRYIAVGDETDTCFVCPPHDPPSLKMRPGQYARQEGVFSWECVVCLFLQGSASERIVLKEVASGKG